MDSCWDSDWQQSVSCRGVWETYQWSRSVLGPAHVHACLMSATPPGDFPETFSGGGQGNFENEDPGYTQMGA